MHVLEMMLSGNSADCLKQWLHAACNPDHSCMIVKCVYIYMTSSISTPQFLHDAHSVQACSLHSGIRTSTSAVHGRLVKRLSCVLHN